MLSEEEKKAIETLTNKRPSEQMLISGKMCVNVLINLIEKQQKEIEEIKEKNNKLMEELDLTTVYISGVYDGEKKVEGKIKAILEEIDFMIKEINQGHLQKYTVGELLSAKRFLQSLLKKRSNNV